MFIECEDRVFQCGNMAVINPSLVQIHLEGKSHLCVVQKANDGTLSPVRGKKNDAGSVCKYKHPGCLNLAVCPHTFVKN